MEETIHAIPRGDPMTLERITGQTLHDALATTKVRSARGSDGWSTKDLVKIPICLCDMLACILALVEHCEQWPEKWIYAKTICLPKSHCVSNPLQIRPITIMAKAYRAWGKIRGRQIALHITSKIPNQIAGACKNISADLIALLNAFEIESALTDQASLWCRPRYH